MSYVYTVESHSLNILMPKLGGWGWGGCTFWKLLFPWISQWLHLRPNIRKGRKILNSYYNFKQISYFPQSVICPVNSIPITVHEISKIVPFSSSSPPVWHVLYVPSVMTESKMRTFPLLSPHIGEKVHHQNCLRTGGSRNSSPQQAK